jgi:diadenosine tetraphosphatase ApaH/serine/threonine PP2A family protein phosphatase
MRIALFSDIHANRQAFEACLAQARAQGAERFVLLGDYVGYGADPDWTVSKVRELVGERAIAIRGNHDNAVSDTSERMNAEAQIAMEWTRGRLDAEQRQFLAGLPMTAQSGDRLYVHAEASEPSAWHYVASVEDASESFAAVRERLIFCGHIHLPQLYSMSVTGKLIRFIPTSDVPIPLLPGRRWLAVLGSVGQPRDGNPAAAYCMLDTLKSELTYCRAPYDVEAAAEGIRQAGLPPHLANRLFQGR